MKFLVAIAILSSLIFCCAATANPNWAHISGGDLIVINGCGFDAYTSVACVWDDRWQSSHAYIQSDTQIVCETPVISQSEFQSLPQYTRLDVVFEGLTRVTYSTNFRFGPALSTFAPTSGFVDGGELLHVNGEGFSDFSYANVTLDGVECYFSVIESDNEITCVIPSGYFNQNAKVEVFFENSPYFFLHYETTYHYGTVVTNIVPTCGSLTGGTRATIYGLHFSDPFLDHGSNRTEVTFVVGNTRYFALDVNWDPQNTSVSFTTPTIPGAVLGLAPDIFVYFYGSDGRADQVPVGTFIYGPRIYPGSFSVHSGGNDAINIFGCGLTSFPSSAFLVTLDGTTSYCQAGTVQLGRYFNDTTEYSGNDLLTCVSSAVACTASPASLTSNLTVVINTGSGTPSYPVGPIVIGPQINVNSVTPSFGPLAGGNIVTLTGVNLGYTSSNVSGWGSVTVSFSKAGFGSLNVFPAQVTIVNDNKLTFVAPTGLVGLTGAGLSFNFGGICTNIPRGTLPTYSFGPQCTTVTPANGHLSGNQTVTLSGLGFLDDGTTADDIEIRVCLNRLNPTPGVCNIFATSTVVSVQENEIVFLTPPFTQNLIECRENRGNRFFGDASTVYVHLKYNGKEFPATLLLPGSTLALLTCGNYRFGPVVTGITPTKGPIGPSGSFSPATPVTIVGSGFDDPLYNKNLLVGFGTIPAYNDNNAVVSDSEIVVNTQWGASSASTVSVTTIFNTCNTTTSATTVTWGPLVTKLLGSDSNGNIYGCRPTGGDVISVIGTGFDEFGTNVQCVIGNTEVPTLFVNATLIQCTTVAAPIGKCVAVTLQFGKICGSNVANFRQSLVVPGLVFYAPRLDAITPNVGHASGNEVVTISGFGFANLGPVYNAVFGAYVGNCSLINDTLIACTTPSNRAEISTDVTVALFFTSVAQQVVAPFKFHYGPVCTVVSPPVVPVNGQKGVQILGTGFIDCTISNTRPFKDCFFTQYQVQFVDPVTGQVLNVTQSTYNTNSTGNSDTALVFDAPAYGCDKDPIVQILFPDATVTDNAQQTIQCSANAIHYGPVFTSQTSQYFQNGVSYGWTGDAVTIVGSGFTDSGIYLSTNTVHCMFGPNEGTTVSVTDTQIVCTAPASNWQNDFQITVEWRGESRSQECVGEFALAAGRFHYGPVMRSSAPNFGYVYGGTPITFTGFAFGCCQVSNIQCAFPNGTAATTATNITGNTVTCLSPPNSFIDNEMVNIGLTFTSPSFGFDESVYIAETLQVLTFRYGPRVDSITPTTTSLSGRGFDGGQLIVTIKGVGFLDPYLHEVFCDYISQTGDRDILSIKPVKEYNVTDTTINCRVPAYCRSCGAIDSVRPRWRRNVPYEYRTELGKWYFRTEEPAVIQQNVPPYYRDAGSANPTYAGSLKYGPVVTSVVGNPVSKLPGGNVLTVNIDDIRDFGNSQALCIFGTTRIASSAGTIVSQAINSTSERNPIPGVVNCTIPAGSFGTSGVLGVILKPNFDASTTLTNGWGWVPFADTLSRQWGPQGINVVAVNGGGFCNYNTVVCLFNGVIATQSAITDDFVVTCDTPPVGPGAYDVQLRFCNSNGNTCNCETSFRLATRSLEELESPLVPSFFTRRGLSAAVGEEQEEAASEETASLSKRGTDPQTGTPYPDGLVVDKQQYYVVGISSFSPGSGNICGGTRVTISGYGFQFFDGISCNFQAAGNDVIERTPDHVVCLSSDLSSSFEAERALDVSEGETCNPIALTFSNNGNVELSVYAPEYFEVGFPIIKTIKPDSIDIDDLPRYVEVTGLFINTIRQEVRCRVGKIAETVGVVVPNDDDDDSTVYCPIPPGGFNGLVIGTYNVEVSFSCGNVPGETDIQAGNFTTNYVTLEITQNPSILDFTPKRAGDIGGTKITVVGNNFNGGSLTMCSFGSIEFGVNVLTQAQIIEGTPLPEPVLPPLNSLVEGNISNFAELEDDGAANDLKKRDVEGVQDKLICLVPYFPVEDERSIEFAITLDGGKTYTRATERLQIQHVESYDDDSCLPFKLVANAASESRLSLYLLVLSVVFVVSLLL